MALSLLNLIMEGVQEEGAVGLGGSLANCANASAGTNGGEGGRGGDGTNGASGVAGANGVAGGHAQFTVSPDTLSLAAGNGGGGGGGGQGGGQGGGGGSGGSGGGGGMARTTTCSQCGTSQNGNGGSGGVGGAGGNGGMGGRGGTASKGSDGGRGGNGGGCIVLSARGLLQFGGVIDISAGPYQNGGPLVPLNSGSAGINPGNNWENGGNGLPGNTGVYGFLSGTCYPITVVGGYGGNGGRGGAGGIGGSGGASGASGSGGNGGRGTPGMVKLHGTIVLTRTGLYTGQIACNNFTSDTSNIYRGRMTLVSSMSNTKVNEQFPVFLDSMLYSGARNATVLSAPSPYSASTIMPIIPQLVGGPATGGFTESNFWNKSQVVTPGNDLVELVTIDTTNCWFNTVKQIFIVNNGGADAHDVVLQVSGFPPYLIGTIPSGAIWTTTIGASRTASIQVGMDITISSSTTETHAGNTLVFNAQVVGGTGNKSYRWLKDGQQIATTGAPNLYLYNVTPAHTGIYTVEVTDSAHTESSDNSVSVVVHPAVNIVQAPVGGVYPKGERIVLSVRAIGGKGKLHYIWKRNGISLSAPDMPYLLLSPAGPEDNGFYTVEIYDEIGTAPFGRVETGSTEIAVQNSLSVHGPSSVWVYEGTTSVPLVVLPSGGVPGYVYQWFKDEDNNGTLDPGEELVNSGKYSGIVTSTLTINNIAMSDDGVYRCIVVDDNGNGISVISSAGYLHVHENLRIVSFTPEFAARNPGQSVLFHAEIAGGIYPLSFSWAGVAQGTLPSSLYPSGNELFLQNLTEANEDSYIIHIRDANYRSVSLSPPAVLLIVDNPLAITGHPEGIHAYVDDLPHYTLSVETQGGYGTIQYIWLRNGAPAPGINNQPNYVFSPLTPALSGRYTCQVWDEVPENILHTNEVEILFAEHMSYTQNLESLIFAPYNEQLSLVVGLTGGMGNLSYQWWHDNGTGPVAVGGNAMILNLGYPTKSQDGEYYVITQDERESLQSNVCRVYVGEDLAITRDPLDVLLYTDEAEYFELDVVTTDGFGTKQYTWYKDGDIVREENESAVYVSPPLDESLSGEYYVKVRDVKDEVVSNPAQVLIGPRMSITQQILGGFITEGESWTFSIGVTGGLGELHYQWRFKPMGSTEIYNIGVDSPVYELNESSVEDSGIYWVEISDGKSVIESTHVVLLVDKKIPAYNIGTITILIVLLLAFGSYIVVRKRKRVEL